MGCSEITVLLSNIVKLARCGVENLNIARHIFITPDFAKIVETNKMLSFDTWDTENVTHCSYAISVIYSSWLPSHGVRMLLPIDQGGFLYQSSTSRSWFRQKWDLTRRHWATQHHSTRFHREDHLWRSVSRWSIERPRQTATLPTDQYRPKANRQQDCLPFEPCASKMKRNHPNQHHNSALWDVLRAIHECRSRKISLRFQNVTSE